MSIPQVTPRSIVSPYYQLLPKTKVITSERHTQVYCVTPAACAIYNVILISLEIAEKIGFQR